MKLYQLILASALALSASAETLQTARIISLSGGNDGLAWVDRQGNLHKFGTTNMVAIVDLSQWSTNAAVSDVDMDVYGLVSGGTGNEFRLNDSGQVSLTSDGDFKVNASSLVLGESARLNNFTGTSYLELNPTVYFGLYNGEALGPDVNITSVNGEIKISPTILLNDSATITSVESGSLPFTSPRFTASAGRSLGMEFVSDSGNQTGFFFESIDDAVANNGIQFYRPGGTHDFALSSLGFPEVLYIPSGGQYCFIHRTSDDGTGAGFQVGGDISASGGYWSEGSQGQTDNPSVMSDDGITPMVLHYVNGLYMGKD